MNKLIRLVLILAMAVVMVLPIANSTEMVAVASVEDASIDVSDVAQLFFPTDNDTTDEQVYLGGFPLGMTIDGKGVTVVGLNEFIGNDGKVCCPAIDSGIVIGDTIIEVEGVAINNSSRLADISAKSQGRQLAVTYIHGGQALTTTITPCMDLSSRQYRMGFWTRDSSSGIGTMTFYRTNMQFASLGHPICDSSGNIVTATDGSIYYCDINDVKMGQKGCAGELKGSFDANRCIGSIHTNNKYGVYGNLSTMPQFDTELIDVASVSQVKAGKAYIYTTVGDSGRQCYEIEIVKVSQSRAHDDKGMVIKITDPELLAITGGIVQGMSGSPIVQEGKLIGAVTHVFVNDPTRGYGIFVGNMLDIADSIGT